MLFPARRTGTNASNYAYRNWLKSVLLFMNNTSNRETSFTNDDATLSVPERLNSIKYDSCIMTNTVPVGGQKCSSMYSNSLERSPQ